MEFPTARLQALPPVEARRLAEQFEWHYPPKHGSWLDMAEIEISIMSRQALNKPLTDLESFKRQVRIWAMKRNAQHVKINWQVKTHNPRIKLARLYPTILYKLTGYTTRVVYQNSCNKFNVSLNEFIENCSLENYSQL